MQLTRFTQAYNWPAFNNPYPKWFSVILQYALCFEQHLSKIVICFHHLQFRMWMSLIVCVHDCQGILTVLNYNTFSTQSFNLSENMNFKLFVNFLTGKYTNMDINGLTIFTAGKLSCLLLVCGFNLYTYFHPSIWDWLQFIDFPSPT